MTLFVLDTDALSLYQRGDPAIVSRVQKHHPEEMAVTVITVEEQLSGWYALLRRARRPQDLAGVYDRLAANVRFLGRLQVLSFSLPAITRYEELQAQKLNVGKMDLRIAAIALEYGAILITRNRRDFERVPGLAIEDWTVDDDGSS